MSVLCLYDLQSSNGWSKTMAQLLVGHNFKTAYKNPTKLHTTFFQHVFNHFVNFQSKWTANVEMTVALKLGVQKSNIIDTSNIGCVWHVLCMVYCLNREVPGLSMVPNCHHYHLRYSLNWSMAQLSSFSDSTVQQTGFAQKRLTFSCFNPNGSDCNAGFLWSTIKKGWKLKLTRLR